MKKLLVFKAQWCQPCKNLAPTINEIEKEIDFEIVRIDVDLNAELTKQYNIRSIPSLVLVDGDQINQILVAPQSKQEILDYINL